MAYRGFSYCNGGRNARTLLLSSICSICFGVMGVTLPARRSCSDVNGWNRLSVLFPASKLAVIWRITGPIFVDSRRRKDWKVSLISFCLGKLDPQPEKLFDTLHRLWLGNVTAINPFEQRDARYTQKIS